MGNTLLILGNGFDLDLGFRTSYGAFMESQEFRNFQEATYLGKYLSDEQNKSKTWIDIEKELSKYCLEINQSGLMTSMKTYGRKLLHQEYESLKDALKKYLRKETSRDYRLDSSSNALRLLYQIGENSSNRIVTFNYTELVENISSNAFASYNHNLLHVHGSLHAEDDIVFGWKMRSYFPKNMHSYIKRIVNINKHKHLPNGYPKRIISYFMAIRLVILIGSILQVSLKICVAIIIQIEKYFLPLW